MNTTIKASLFYLLTCSILLISVDIFAQVTQERAEYKGSLVVPNSIIVHVDEAKTKSVTQLTAKLERVKANYKIETNKYLKEHGIQEWDVQIEDYDDVLSELNSVPGISAYPNYIFKRGDFEPVKIEGTVKSNLEQINSPSHSFNFMNSDGNFIPALEAAQEYEDYELPLVYLEDFSGITETDWDVDFHSVSFSMDNIVHNGAFMGQDFWFDNSFDADFGSIHYDDTLMFEVTNAGNQWDLQAYQILSPEQIDKLSQGGEWELSFDAMSPDGAKTFHVFLGHNGGDWARYWAPGGDGDVTVDDTMKTYTLTADITQTWENMKLGFEVAASTADLFIDNVALRPVPKNIVQNGDFSNGDSLWTGIGSTVSFDDSLMFTIATAGNPWDVQAFQELSTEQISQLSQGGEWKLTFDAMSPDGAKSFHVFLGENGGSWARYWDGNVDVDGEMKTYTLTTEITQTWENMKLGFEVGASTAGLVIDNISLMRSVPENSYENIFVDEFSSGQGWTGSDNLAFSVNTEKNIQYHGQVVSPVLDLSDLDSTKKYRLIFDYEQIAYSDFIMLGIQDVNDEDNFITFDMTPYSGYVYYWLDSFVGDTIQYGFYTEGGKMAGTNETLFTIDNIRIEEYPVNDQHIGLQYSFWNDGTFAGGSVPDADIDAFEAWELETGNDSVIVVVMDDGVDFNHPDLVNQAWVNPGEDLNGDGIISEDEVNGIDDDQNGFVDDFHGWSPVYESNIFVNPGSFHGTHVAGTIGAEGGNGIGVAGVSQDVSMISVMIFDESGYTTSFAIMEGYRYMTAIMEKGVDVVAINQSWGGGENMISEEGQAFVKEMTQHALDHNEYGAVWVVSAGNSSLNRDDQYYFSIPNNINSPNVITVASSDANEMPSGFTDFGNYTVDIYAPGSDIASTYPGGYAYLSGTSMASPHVSGSIALAKAMFPDDSGVDLMTRILASGDVFEQYTNVGESERLNVNNAINNNESITSDVLVSHYRNATFQRVFFEEEAKQTIGLVNRSSQPITINSFEIAGNDDSWSTDIDQIINQTIESGGVLSIPMEYDNRNSTDSLYMHFAAAEFGLSDGSQVVIGMYGRELTFPTIEISNDFTDGGVVPAGSVVEGEFEIINNSELPLYFDVVQSLQRFMPEESNFIETNAGFKPVKSFVKNKPKIGSSKLDMYKDLPSINDQYSSESIKLEVDFGMLEHGASLLWFDDLNDPERVYSQWIVRDLSGVGETFELIPLESPENLAFFAGDFENGYLNDAYTDAITPSFDFSNLFDAAGDEYIPAYLEFDYAALLEQGYDLLSVPVFVDGWFEGFLDMTDYGTLIADGNYRRTMIDISPFAGQTDVRFGFLMESDSEIVEGWGALFDNVGISVVPKPYFISETDGLVEPGTSDLVKVGVETEKIQGTGGFELSSIVFNNSLESFYYGAPVHYLGFMIENNPPVANDDTMMVVSGDVINTLDIAAFAASNDYDDSGQAFVTDITDPVYGSFKYLEIDGPPYYVAPLNFDGMDMITYQISDGTDYAEAVIYIMVMAEPGFKTGANQQFVLLEDNELTLSTMTMAAGVGGMDKNMMVWGKSMHDAVQVTHTPGEHVIMITATEDYYGQSEAMLYAGHENHVMDSMMVSVVITPVNDAPVASFNIEQNQAGGSEFNFANTSNDARDPEGAIVQYEWNFGDGTTSNEKDPYHNYSAVGDYSVTLKVTDNSGSEAEYSENVSVTVLTSSEDLTNPNVYSLAQNYPNPFNPSTLIQYSIAEPGNVTLEVYNMLGQKVAQLVNGTQNAGAHTIQFDASALSSGVYIYQLKSGSYLETRKMMLIK